MLKINSIYKSIQGESNYTGLPCVFIRLAGCNLRCSYCDTKYAYNKGRAVTIPAILTRVKALGCHLVQVTGGEPLLQQDTPKLINELIKQGYKTLLGTNGTYPINSLNKKCVKLMDIKCPSSKAGCQANPGNLKHLTNHDEVKFVISNAADYNYAKTMLKKHSLTKYTNIVFSPAYRKLNPKVLASWILKDNLSVKLGLQIHKYIWNAKEKNK